MCREGSCRLGPRVWRGYGWRLGGVYSGTTPLGTLPVIVTGSAAQSPYLSVVNQIPGELLLVGLIGHGLWLNVDWTPFLPGTQTRVTVLFRCS